MLSKSSHTTRTIRLESLGHDTIIELGAATSRGLRQCELWEAKAPGINEKLWLAVAVFIPVFCGGIGNFPLERRIL